jgi:single-strand DNA-binding protein
LAGVGGLRRYRLVRVREVGGANDEPIVGMMRTVMAVNLRRPSPVRDSSTAPAGLHAARPRYVGVGRVNGGTARAGRIETNREDEKMFETPIAVVGTIITDPIRRPVGDQDVYKFRMASNSRRRTADGNWEPGNSLYASVSCWGKGLGKGVGGSLGKGDPVIVVGYVYTSEYDDREGNRRSSLEVRATAVGPDLARSIASVDRLKNTAASSDDAAATKGDEPGDGAAAAESDDAVGGQVLPVAA